MCIRPVLYEPLLGFIECSYAQTTGALCRSSLLVLDKTKEIKISNDPVGPYCGHLSCASGCWKGENLVTTLAACSLLDSWFLGYGLEDVD